MVTQVDTQRESIIDGYLDSFDHEMRWAVELVCSWDHAEEIERVDLAAEWTLIMDFYVRLLTYERDRHLSPAQQHRFDAIRDVFKAHEPLLADVLGSDWVMTDPPESWFA